MSQVVSGAKIQKGLQYSLINESFWGLISTGVQVLSMTLFFVLIAHNYPKQDLAKFMVSNTIYQLIASISNLGLSSWFVRELASDTTGTIPTKFLRLQLISGLLFFLISSVTALALYSDYVIVQLILLLGINILVDNFIYSVKLLNISLAKQRRSVVLQVLDALSKLLAVILAVSFGWSIVHLVGAMLLFRLILAGIYIIMGFASAFNFRAAVSIATPLSELKHIIVNNWYFLVLGSISLIYWRISNIIVFNYLSLQDVANYEVAFRLFSIAQMLPIVVSSSFLPRLVNLLAEQQHDKAKSLMSLVCCLGFLYGLFVWSLINSFGMYLIPLVFGRNYSDAYLCARQMSLTLLIFPTGIVQAALLTAMKLERKDMLFNIFSLAACILLALLGLQFIEKSIWVVNASIFISFFLFHLCQDTLLVNKKFFSYQQTIGSYIIVLCLIGGYWWLQARYGLAMGFAIFWGLLVIAGTCTSLVKKPQTWFSLLNS